MIYKAQQLAEREHKTLASYAVFSDETKGRDHKERNHKFRTVFQHDRDRIIHSKSFRRLKHKTQVFLALEGDHYRDRLTHTLEVSQIARDISRTLGLNEDLAETIALAHDLGHTPFGHGGEEALDQALQQFGENFEHNHQSKRIVEEIEEVNPKFPGLNLSFEVRDGLIKHQSAYDQIREKIRIHPSLEAQVVNLADEIAYNCHDLDDGLRSNFLEIRKVKKLKIWKMAEENLLKYYKKLPDFKKYRQKYISGIIHNYINNIYKQTELNLKKNKITKLKDVYKCPDYLVSFAKEFKEINNELRDFLMKNFYLHAGIVKKTKQGQKIIKFLFNKYLANRKLLPAHLQAKIKSDKDLIHIVRDYIAGMTDNYAIAEYKKLAK